MPLQHLGAKAPRAYTSVSNSPNRLVGGIARTAGDTTLSDGGVTIVLNSTTEYYSPDVRRCGELNGMAMNPLFSAGR